MSDADPSMVRGDQAAPAKLLVCDDSPIERAALTQFLIQNGYDVAVTTDGQSAVQHIRQQRVDLLLLDLRMAGGDGFTVLKYIQEHHAALPVILLSGMSADEIQHKMHFLPKPELPPLLMKPVDPEQLLQVIVLQLSGGLPSQDSMASS